MLPDLTAMSNVDVRTVDKASLMNLEDAPINKNLPRYERMLEYIKRIQNPYCYICNGIVIKETHSNNGRTMEDCLEQYISTLI